MRGRSYTPSPPRGYGRRGRSPSPRGRYGGGGGRSRDRDLPTSLLVRNLRHDCRPEDLRRPFEQFGPLKDIYLPRDYYTGEPRGFGFVQFVDATDACEAKHQMDGYLLLGRELTVVFAEENRKKPTDMRTREQRGGFRDNRRRSPRRSPPSRRGRSRSRDYSPPKRRHHSRSFSPRDERYIRERSYSHSPAYNGTRGHGSRGRAESPGRSLSPVNKIVSPRQRQSLSPGRDRSVSPIRSRSGSPRQGRSLSLRQGRSASPVKGRSPSPRRGRSISPRRNRSPSP